MCSFVMLFKLVESNGEISVVYTIQMEVIA